MKVSKLYIKIFVSVLLGLIVAEALMFGAFRSIYRRGFRQEVGQVVDAHAILIRSFVHTRLADGANLQQVAVELAGIVPGDVWALDEQGRTIAASLPQLAPPPLDDFDNERMTQEGVRLDFEDDALLALLPLDYPDGGRGQLVFEFRKGHRDGPGEKTFALALAGVAVAFAFLLYPLSRLLGRPLRELRDSVLRIADGDLDHRVRALGQDEIGELGRAFNQMADRVERMVDGTRELTAHVSHELRSPLARIRVAAELLHERSGAQKDVSAPDRARQIAGLHDSINQEIADLDRLIGRILELSRLDLKDPAPTVPRSAAKIFEQLGELAQRYSVAFERRGLVFRLRLPQRPAALDKARTTMLTLSPADLQTIVSAVLDNAVKYAHGRVAMFAILDSDDAALRMIIQNDLAPAELEAGVDCERIFEPFQRGAVQLADANIDGAGLGLAIARKALENAGGSIEARRRGAQIQFEIRMPSSARNAG
ncbi:MAG: HAMP domain-containing histidine kinase [bacterium]|nr:HAMP domain-containing histidine kinase [bacterium]